MKRHPEERNYYGKDDDAADAFFRQSAKVEGLPYHEWCQKYGIMDRSALAKIFRHESSLEASHRESKQPPSVVLGRGNRRVRTQGPVPFEVRLQSDFRTEGKQVRRTPK